MDSEVSNTLFRRLAEAADSVTTTVRSRGSLGDIFFALSVNLLLYVTLIVVFYMLVRFYLEEEPTAIPETTLPVTNTATSTRRVMTSTGYASVPTTEDDLELVPSNPEQTEVAKHPSMDDLELLANTGSTVNVNLSTSKSTSSILYGIFHPQSSNSSSSTRQEEIQRLVICSIGLIVSFSIWGLVQERMLTQTYDGEYFQYSYGLVFMNRLGGLVLSAVLMHSFNVSWVPGGLWEFSIPSVANMLSSWCQYEALRYVAFPVVMLAKAFKMVPVMLMGSFLYGNSYSWTEYGCGGLVGLGLWLFLSSSEGLSLSWATGEATATTGVEAQVTCGVVLLILFLLFDSFTGQWQARHFKARPSLSPLQMMLVMNGFSTVFSFITLVHQEELAASIGFVVAHPTLALHVSLFALSSTVGQLFIFYTVKHFGAVMFSVIMSVRILCSTVLSCWVYGHPVSELGVVGILIVCAATGYRLGIQGGASLLSWKEHMAPSGPLFREWHEHLDI